MTIRDNELQKRCSSCPWRKEMYRDDKNHYISIYCMFPRCIWTFHEPREVKPLKKVKDIKND